MFRVLFFSAIVFLSFVTALGDVFVKKATIVRGASVFCWLITAGIIYALTAFGWFLVLKRVNLSIAGALYAVCLVTFLVFFGIFYFQEDVNYLEIIGIAMAFGSIILLYRFI